MKLTKQQKNVLIILNKNTENYIEDFDGRVINNLWVKGLVRSFYKTVKLTPLGEKTAQSLKE